MRRRAKRWSVAWDPRGEAAFLLRVGAKRDQTSRLAHFLDRLVKRVGGLWIVVAIVVPDPFHGVG